jgi:hypothetical protein
MTALVAPATLSLGRIGRATLIAAAISGLANVALGAALRAGLGIDSRFAPLTPAAIAIFTVACTLVGGAVFAVIARLWPSDAVRRFAIVAVVVVVVSLGAPLSLLSATPAQWPGVSPIAVFALMPLHLVAATVLVMTVKRSFRVTTDG